MRAARSIILFSVLSLASGFAQLPTARLLTIFPPGGKAGSPCEVTVAGIDLDDASAILFSHPNIAAALLTNGPGKFLVSIAGDVPAGLYDARVIGRYGISNPRRFAVGHSDEALEKQNDSFDSATELSVGTTMNARAEANAMDFFKFLAAAGQRIVLECDAAKLDSRMDPSLVLYDRSGRELKQSRQGGVLEFLAPKHDTYVVKVHDVLFGGGNEFFYRLAVHDKEETPQHAEEPETIKPPCEIAGRFYPAADVDRYSFEVKKGEVWWAEVFSHRLGLPTDPLLIINDQEFNDIDANPGGREFTTSSRDAMGRFEAKEDGVCRIQVRDLFNRITSDPRLAYRLAIRKEAPNFELIAMPQGPPPKKDSREALVWTSVLRRGETVPIKVVALRQDGFKGDITVQAADLPSGVSSSHLSIPGDKTSGTLLLTASETATNSAGAISIVGQASVGTRAAKAATILWNVPDYNNEPVRSRLADAFAMAVCEELAPISISAAQQELPATGKGTIPLTVVRRGEFNEAFKLKAYGLPALESLKEIEVKEKGTNAVLELDVAQHKLPPGTHTFYLQGQTKGKYPVQKDKTKDVTITVHSAPITLKVSPPQTASAK